MCGKYDSSAIEDVVDTVKNSVGIESPMVLPVAGLGEQSVAQGRHSLSPQMLAVEEAIRKLQNMASTKDLKHAVRKIANEQERLDVRSKL